MRTGGSPFAHFRQSRSSKPSGQSYWPSQNWSGATHTCIVERGHGTWGLRQATGGIWRSRSGSVLCFSGSTCVTSVSGQTRRKKKEEKWQQTTQIYPVFKSLLGKQNTDALTTCLFVWPVPTVVLAVTHMALQNTANTIGAGFRARLTRLGQWDHGTVDLVVSIWAVLHAIT